MRGPYREMSAIVEWRPGVGVGVVIVESRSTSGGRRASTVGLDVGGAPLARGESLPQFVKKEIAAELAKAADIAHDNLDHATRDELDARGVVVHKIYETGPADVLTFFWQLDEIA